MGRPLAGAVSGGGSVAYCMEHAFNGLASMNSKNTSPRKRKEFAAGVRAVGAPPNDNETEKRKGSGAPTIIARSNEANPIVVEAWKRARKKSASKASGQRGQRLLLAEKDAISSPVAETKV